MCASNLFFFLSILSKCFYVHNCMYAQCTYLKYASSKRRDQTAELYGITNADRGAPDLRWLRLLMGFQFLIITSYSKTWSNFKKISLWPPESEWFQISQVQISYYNIYLNSPPMQSSLFWKLQRLKSARGVGRLAKRVHTFALGL